MDKYKKFLKEYIAFKSVSADPKFQNDIQLTVKWLSNLFTENNFKVDVIEGYDNPILFAEYIVDPELETALVYGHYDVQPADKEDGWTEDPFTVLETDDRLIARGMIDNKGQFLVHLVTILELIETKKLKYNVKFIIEGNEETGSPNIHKFLTDHKRLLESDFVIVSDATLIENYPTIEVSLRGIVNLEITIQTSTQDLHSGEFGGVVPSSTKELSKLISKFHDDKNRILIPGFYDNVSEPTEEELENNKNTPFNLKNYKKITGVSKIFSPLGNDFYTTIGLEPSIEVTGFQGGYIGEGFKNVIPSKSTARISIRIVQNQTTKEIVVKVTQFIKNNIPDYVDFELREGTHYEAFKLDISHEKVKKSENLLKKVYGDKIIYNYVGMTLPIAKYFDEILQIPILMIPIANEDGRMHGVDENFEIDKIKKGFEFSKLFFSK